MINSQMTDDPNANGQMAGGQDMNQMNGQMMNGGMMQNPMNGQMMNGGMMGNPMNGQMMNNGMMGNPMGGQMMNNGMMQNPMNGQMMQNGMMQNPMGGQMMNNGMMGNPMNGQMMNNGMMQNQMNGQMMNTAVMQNPMNGQMMNNGMMQNQMGGQMMNGGMMNNQMVAYGQPETAPAVFDQNALLAKMEKEMVNSSEVQTMVQSIDLSNFDAIQMFGKEAMEEMSRVSDAVVQDQTRAMLLEGKTTNLLAIFSKLFSQIDPSELNDKGGLFGKIFGDLKRKVEAFIAKYQKISVDIDKIYAELKNYEEESRAGNRKLAMMYDANLNTFHALKVYIYAAEQCTINLNREIEEQTRLQQQTGNVEITNQINKLNSAKHLMEKQYSMLMTAQNVALQALPQINIQQLTNYNIISKVNEYFLIGLPIMKQGIAQAIMLKRQKIMTESLAGLDKKMNEMMIRNAQNTVETAKSAMQLSEQTSISAETLETTWKTIVNGIDEVNKIQAEGSKKRIEDAQKLEKIKSEFGSKFGTPQKKVN
ncbi:MAG: toxic anion resistance protein [Treponema sp.]|nr:toxic anion resistance protein [Treponema sp.]